MDRIRIRGGRPLAGEIQIGGAKNAALPLMASGLLTEQRGDAGQCASTRRRRHDELCCLAQHKVAAGTIAQ